MIVTLSTTFTPADTAMPVQARVFIDILAAHGGALPKEILCELAKDQLKTVQTPESIFNHYNKRLFAANDYLTVTKVAGEEKAKVTSTGLALAPKVKKAKAVSGEAKALKFFAEAEQKVASKNVAAKLAKAARARVQQDQVL